jgi:hypothetical protein
MKVFTLLTALTITTIATAAQAQWIASQPSALTIAPGARVVAPFGLIGSVNYTTGVYNVAAPIVVWQGARHPRSLRRSRFQPLISIRLPLMAISS